MGVDEFHLDPALQEALKGIRESVRRLFEQLRLRNENEDVSGKDRLERVPALAKRNFRNLTGPSAELAIKEAWRLVDFIEGGSEASLSARARAGLRVIELDKQMQKFRASDCWTEAAASLRHALGVAQIPDRGVAAAPSPAMMGDHTSPIIAPTMDVQARQERIAETELPPEIVPRRGIRGRALFAVGILAMVAGMAVGARLWFADSPDPRIACIALEQASSDTLATHRAVVAETSLSPLHRRANPKRHVYIISDSPNGGPLQSIWTTSQFSYVERSGPNRPGGGRADFRLRVGGWGDTYLSLLKVPVPTNRVVQRAVIQLTVIGDEADSRPTTMSLRATGDNWTVNPGTDNRLWWRDCPGSVAVRNGLPAPGPPDSVYEIDITELYNRWARGLRLPYGILLEPEKIGSWGAGRPHYPNYSTFYSTRASDPENRPRLVLTY